jgi:hypothetical protein
MPYVHQPLDLNKSQIRLFRLQPLQDGQVSGMLETFNDATCPPYEALSYVWASESADQTVLVNGKDYVIGSNLWVFLEQASSQSIVIEQGETYASKYLWIDQICIDQNSKAEKNQQVQRMASIYQSATRCIVWLGRSNVQSIDAMDTIAEACKELPGNTSAVWKRELATLQKYFTRARVYDKGGLTDLFNKPYWTRVWTVQEFWLSKHLLIVHNNKAVHWESLSQFWGIYLYVENETTQNVMMANAPAIKYIEQKHSTEAWKFISETEDRASTSSWSLGSALLSFSSLQASDMRDKIYGLLGVVKEEERLKIDYSKTPREVYWDAITFMNSQVEIPAEHWETLFILGLSMDVSAREIFDFRVKKGQPGQNLMR